MSTANCRLPRESTSSANFLQPACKNVGETERWLSLGTGLALLSSGLVRRSAGGALLMLIGGGLIYRGVTGYCSLYQALDQSTAT